MPPTYRAENVFWVPKEARWPHLQANAKQPTIGKTLDDAMTAIERDNQTLKGTLPKDYARPGLDKQRLGELIDLISTVGLGEKDHRSKDVLGRVYEYFLSLFASAEGKKGGQFYTPRCVVQVLVEMLAPYKGRVFDPCCWSAFSTACGTRLYLPVFHPGAHFYVGDPHSAQGDGEVSGTAIEQSLTGVFRFTVHKGKTITAPWA